MFGAYAHKADLLWMAEFAAWQLASRQIGLYVQTSDQRCCGRAYAKGGVRVGERIFYKVPLEGPQPNEDKLQS